MEQALVNLLILRPEEVAGSCAEVTGRRAAHVHAVLKSRVGERIRVGVVRSSEGTAEVAESTPERLVLQRLELGAAGPAPSLRLVIALPRPKALRRLLQTAASFRVAHIDLVNAWRVQKSYWDSPSVAPESLDAELTLGCEQGRHVWIPTIETHRLLMPYLDNELSSLTGPKLLAHPGSDSWLSDVAPAEGATIAIGPEGGWIEKELASFEERGFQKISVSSAILRSEIALAATLGQWELCSRSIRAE